MPDIPNLPGVPSLSNYTPNDAVLLLADVTGAALLLPSPIWGIYMDGIPVIIPASMVPSQLSFGLSLVGNIAALIGVPNIVPVAASTVEFDYSGESPISNYPQENGAFQSYNKVQLPFDVKLKLAVSGSGSERQAFFNILDAIRKSTSLVSVVSPEKVYASCNCKHVDYRRSGRSGVDLVVADVWFEEVRVIAASTFSNTKVPVAAGQQSIGNVQSQTPSTQFASSLSVGGGFF